MPATPGAPPRFIIVDATGYVYRAYFALKIPRPGHKPVELSTMTGLPTGALLVFASMLMRLYLDERPDLCCVVFDAGGGNFRHQLDPNYKANRREMPDDLKPQMPWFEPIVQGFKLPILRVPGVEADDVIASLTRQARVRGFDVVIFAADKDMMQLVDDHVSMIDAMRDVTFDVAAVTAKFGVPPAQVGDWLALRGDAIDNIPGVPGVGEVTATKLLQEYGSLDGIIANAAKLKPKMASLFSNPEVLEKLRVSRALVSLRDDIPVPEVTTLRRADWDAAALEELFTTLEFSRLKERLAATFFTDRDTYRTITDAEALVGVVDAAKTAGELAFVSESENNVLIGVALAVPGQPPVYVPVGHRYLGAPAQLGAEAVVAALAPILADPAVAKYVHDLKKEILAFGPTVANVRSDAILAAHLLDPGAGGYGIVPLAKRYLEHVAITRDEVCGKGREHRAFDQVDLAAATRYLAEAADITLALGRVLRARVEPIGMLGLLDDVELPLARVLAVMERHGIRVDVEVLRGLGQKLGEDCQRLERQIQEIAGYPLNPLSPKQLGDLLFEKLGLHGENMRRTKSGGFSTDAEQLEELVDQHPVVKMLLEHRELIKLKGTYVDTLPQWVSPVDHRLHTSYVQAGASTGRLASQNPNVQNIPIRSALGREVRRAFVAEDGWLLVSADYSQIELRVVAHLSDDPVLCDAFARDIDVHTQTAAEVFGVTLAEVTSEQRRVAKAVNYGLGYGQSEYGLSRALDIPRDTARKYIETYFIRFARVREFMEGVIAETRKQQSVRTLLNRRIPIPGIASSRYPERSGAERFARNAPIQGSAADILKLAMLRMARWLESNRSRARMLLTVHDELVFEVPEGEAQEFAAVAKREMEAAYALKVPLKVDTGVARSWADAH